LIGNDRHGPGTVDIFRQQMDLSELCFENVDIVKTSRELELESRFNLGKGHQCKKSIQTTISDFVC